MLCLRCFAPSTLCLRCFAPGTSTAAHADVDQLLIASVWLGLVGLKQSEVLLCLRKFSGPWMSRATIISHRPVLLAHHPGWLQCHRGIGAEPWS